MDILDLLRSDGSITVNKFLANKYGLIPIVVFSELVSKYKYFVNEKIIEENGWFYCTISDLKEATSLNRHYQDKAIEKLVEVGLIFSEIKGMPARRHFKINISKVCETFTNKFATDSQTSLRQIDKHVCEKNTTINNTNNNTKNNTNNNYISQNQSKNENQQVFDHWNEKRIIKHRKLVDRIKRSINGALGDYSLDEVKLAIDNYHVILTDDRYYWTHAWGLKEFLQRGLEKFLDFEIAHQNFLKDKPKAANRGQQKVAAIKNVLSLAESMDRQEGIFQ